MYQFYKMDKVFKFEPYLKTVLWGGEKIASFKGIATSQKEIGESWEISGVPGHESVVSEGSDKGLNLVQLIEKYKEALLGESIYKQFGNTFPLLVKIIDAKKDLSVQVHPNDALAKERHNSFGKTEMWYIIDAEKDAKIYAGLSKSISKEDYETMVKNHTIMDAIASHSSQPGDIFFLPAGRIHAIGGGNLLAEIQQTSDITYRVYDFDRRDANGNPRQLHTEEAKDAIDYTVYPEYKSEYDRDDAHALLAKCQYFDVRLYQVNEHSTFTPDNDSFVIAMCLNGNAIINGVSAKQGETLLIPACYNTLEISGNATILTATI